MYKILKKIIPNYFKKIIIKEVDKNYLFSGWGMKSRSCPPWQYVHYKKEETYLSYFNNIQKELEKKITSSKFISNQFPINTLAKIKEFKWRHYTYDSNIEIIKKNDHEEDFLLGQERVLLLDRDDFVTIEKLRVSVFQR